MLGTAFYLKGWRKQDRLRTVAAFLFRRRELPQTRINVAVISGGNVEPKMLADIMDGQESVVRSR